jgi:hypothetical protein
MTIDGFLQFLGLVVAVYALLGVVNRYRLRLLGGWLAAPKAVEASEPDLIDARPTLCG